jgi:hypothetical protein
LFTSWSLGVGWGHNRENHIHNYVFILKKKIFFSRTSRSISIKLDTNHPLKGILQIKGQVFFKGEIITKIQKWGGVI